MFVPVGGGGLIAGIGSYIKALMPGCARSSASSRSRPTRCTSRSQAGRRVTLDHVGLFADGVAVREVGELTFELARQTVDEVVRVSNDEICAAIKDVFDDTRSVTEPAGALAVAGLKAWVERARRARARGWRPC